MKASKAKLQSGIMVRTRRVVTLYDDIWHPDPRPACVVIGWFCKDDVSMIVGYKKDVESWTCTYDWVLLMTNTGLLGWCHELDMLDVVI